MVKQMTNGTLVYLAMRGVLKRQCQDQLSVQDVLVLLGDAWMVKQMMNGTLVYWATRVAQKRRRIIRLASHPLDQRIVQEQVELRVRYHEPSICNVSSWT